MTIDGTRGKGEIFDPWMLVEKKFRHKSRDFAHLGPEFKAKKIYEGSRFMALVEMEGNVGQDLLLNAKEHENRRRKGKELVPVTNVGDEHEGYKTGQFNNKNHPNELGFKNLAKPSQILNVASVRPASSVMLAKDPIGKLVGAARLPNNNNLLLVGGSKSSSNPSNGSAQEQQNSLMS